MPVLNRVSCFAEKWLANADRWNDTSVLSRDAVDLAYMVKAWGIEAARAGAKLAANAYGEAVARAARTKLLRDQPYRKQCADSLAISDAKALLAGLKALGKVAKGLS